MTYISSPFDEIGEALDADPIISRTVVYTPCDDTGAPSGPPVTVRASYQHGAQADLNNILRNAVEYDVVMVSISAVAQCRKGDSVQVEGLTFAIKEIKQVGSRWMWQLEGPF